MQLGCVRTFVQRKNFKKDFLFICRFLVVAFSEMNEALEEFDPPSNLCGVDRKEHVAPKV